MKAPITAEHLTIVPANEATWEDLAAIFGTTDYACRCRCQRFKVVGWFWRDTTFEERAAMLEAQTACGDPTAAATSGLVAYVDDEPAGWVAVEPRTAYPKLRTSRIPWKFRDEDKDDDGIWAVTCFVVRKSYRSRGLTYPLAAATIDFARERGAERARGLSDDHPGRRSAMLLIDAANVVGRGPMVMVARSRCAARLGFVQRGQRRDRAGGVGTGRHRPRGPSPSRCGPRVSRMVSRWFTRWARVTTRSPRSRVTAPDRSRS